MAKKKDNKEEVLNLDKAIENLTIGTTIGQQTFYNDTLKGKKVSLNLKKESFYGIGKIWLTSEKYSTVIPETITPQQEMQVRRAIRDGILVEGEVYIPPIDRDAQILTEYWNLIKSFGLDPKETKSQSTIKFKNLLRNGVDRNWTAKEIARHCIEQEKKYKNRPSIIKILEQVHKHSDCPETLLEEPSR